MKQIPLTQGKVAIVDDDMFEYLNQWKWFAHKGGNTFYACRQERTANWPKTPKQRMIMMHVVILGVESGIVDHINGDGTDNRIANLRKANRLQNGQNRRKHNTSNTYKGVYKRGNKFVAKIGAGVYDPIKKECKKLTLGTFTDEIEAAKAYDEAAKKHFGEFAKLNFQHN